MVPPGELLPDVLPTDRLFENAKARPPIREELRRVRNLRSAVAVASMYLQVAVVLVGAVTVAHPLGYAVAFVLCGRTIVQCNTLAHEAVHRTLFSNRTVNDVVGKWLLSCPAFVPFELYRRGHIAHHRDEMGPEEPDVPLYARYPITPASLRRKLMRDALGITGFTLLRGLFRGLRRARTRPAAARIIGTQVVLVALATVVGRPELYLLWIVPYLTQWRVTNRLRAIAEHGGMERNRDRRATTHVVRQTPIARFLMVPYNIGLHIEHHVDMGIPCWNLPAMHRELRASGWVPDVLVYPNYRSLWRKLASAEATA